VDAIASRTWSRNRSSSQSESATPTTGISSRPWAANAYSDENNFLRARSPVAPNRTRVSERFTYTPFVGRFNDWIPLGARTPTCADVRFGLPQRGRRCNEEPAESTKCFPEHVLRPFAADDDTRHKGEVC
jgi:hypothetical protein